MHPVRPRPVWISSATSSTRSRRADLGGVAQVAVGRNQDAGLALDRLEQEGAGVGRDGALQRLGVAEGNR